MTHKFCVVLLDMLASKQLADSKIVYYTSPALADTTNAIYLLGVFLVLHLRASPNEVSQLFASMQNHILPYRDATWVKSTFDLHLIDCWKGIRHAVKVGLYDPATFNMAEYFYYDQPCYGDLVSHKFESACGKLWSKRTLLAFACCIMMLSFEEISFQPNLRGHDAQHEVVRGKFFAFKGPTEERRMVGPGQFSKTPSDYVDVFKNKNITSVVRLNAAECES